MRMPMSASDSGAPTARAKACMPRAASSAPSARAIRRIASGAAAVL